MSSATSTDGLAYPILLVGKFGLLQYREDSGALVERASRLKSLAGVPWFHVVDNQLRRYQVKKIEFLGGAGGLLGYTFSGPYPLQRRVRFRAELKLLHQLEARSAAEILADFMRGSQGALKDDLSRFWREFERFPTDTTLNLSKLWTFYSDFKWGDDLEVET